jgi:hypothetical protein
MKAQIYNNKVVKIDGFNNFIILEDQKKRIMNNLGRKKLVVFYNRFYYAIASINNSSNTLRHISEARKLQIRVSKRKTVATSGLDCSIRFSNFESKRNLRSRKRQRHVRNFTPYFTHDELILSNQLSKLEQDLRLLSQQYAPEITSSEITQLVSFTSEQLTQFTKWNYRR